MSKPQGEPSEKKFGEETSSLRGTTERNRGIVDAQRREADYWSKHKRVKSGEWKWHPYEDCGVLVKGKGQFATQEWCPPIEYPELPPIVYPKRGEFPDPKLEKAPAIDSLLNTEAPRGPAIKTPGVRRKRRITQPSIPTENPRAAKQYVEYANIASSLGVENLWRAVAYQRRALELDPKNKNIRKRLKQLELQFVRWKRIKEETSRGKEGASPTMESRGLAPRRQSPAQEYVEKATRAYVMGDLRLALSYQRKALAMDPANKNIRRALERYKLMLEKLLRIEKETSQ